MRSGPVQYENFLFAGWVLLAALFFTVGGIFMKLSEGLTKFWPTVIVFALFVTGAALQTLAMKREELAVTYLMVVGIEVDPRVPIWRPAVQRELHSGAHCQRAADRGRHHLVALSLLTPRERRSAATRHTISRWSSGYARVKVVSARSAPIGILRALPVLSLASDSGSPHAGGVRLAFIWPLERCLDTICGSSPFAV